MSSLNKDDVVLLALQDGDVYTPVQVQKLLFLIEEKASLTKKALFNFIPYHYGPFDKEVYSTLDKLAADGLVNIHCGVNQQRRKYCLTKEGLSAASGAVSKIESTTNDYIKELAHYVHSQSFTDLVSAIYQEYPQMKENSIFND